MNQSNNQMATLASIKFSIGDKEYTVNAKDVTPDTRLNDYLRDYLHMTATKKMCFEGGCGACVVAVEKVIDGATRTIAVNSCLVSILSCDGWKIYTNETIGNPIKGYHEIQQTLANKDGLQCGFCSSGMVMNMYALNKDGKKKTQAELEDAFGGHICRCTGYRPILDTAKSFASDAPKVQDDIEDLPQSTCCKSQNCCQSCPGVTETPKESICLEVGDSKWYKVSTLLEMRSAMRHTDGTYQLVAGNTARGVYPNEPSADVFIDISNVSELKSWSLSGKTLTIGANKSLNRTWEILTSNSSNDGWKYLATIADHIKLIAGYSIRNFATLAGNLMIKYKHNEFPSDIFLLFDTFNAKFVIEDNLGFASRVTPKQFLSTNLKLKYLRAIELSKLDSEDTYKYATYKIMTRAQNAHAMINAGFLMKVENNLVKSANIAYGGINKSFIRASKTEQYLIGKNIFTNLVLQGALNILETEIQPTNDPPMPSAEYTKKGSVALFYKFILKVAPSDAIDPRLASGGKLIERPVSTATQEYGTNKDMYPVTEPVHKVEGLAQASGQAQYIPDMPDLPGQLHAAFVLTNAIANSKVTAINTDDAMKLDGVVAVFTAKDFPVNNFVPPNVDYPSPEKILCEDTVEFFNQPVAIVVAKTFGIALGAADLVKVTYQKPEKNPYLTIDDVLNDGEAVKERITEGARQDRTRTGTDVTKVIKGTFYMGQQQAFHMELQCCNVIPTEDGLEVYPSTQWMDFIQAGIAQSLNIIQSKVSVHNRRVGGGFGAKVSRNCPISCAAALAAYKLREPVKMYLTLPTNMRICGGRNPCKLRYEVGVNDEGVIQYFDGDYYVDFGVGVGNDANFFLFAGAIGNCYKKDTWSWRVLNVKTDTATKCYVRAPGSIDGIGTAEVVMDTIAQTLNLDPLKVRMANYDVDKHPMLANLLTTMNTWGDIEKRQQAVDQFNQDNRWMKKALKIVPMSWHFSLVPRQCLLLSIYHVDGSVGICHSGIEVGQGINTKVIQACAYKLGIPMDMITVKPGYSQATANGFCTSGSMTSELVVYSLLIACDELLARMKPIRDKMTNPTWSELTRACYTANINLSTTSISSVNYQEYDVYAVCAVEVLVDILSGSKMISRVDIIEDIGDSMSPRIDIGQLEGAFVMGCGHYTQEHTIFNDQGELLTDRTWNYKPSGAKDIPCVFRVKFPENNPNPIGVLKSKAIGEPPMCLSVGVPLAIREAVMEARRELDPNDNTILEFDGPTTVEKTFLYANPTQGYILK